LPWIASFVDSDNFAVLEFVTRLHGALLIPSNIRSQHAKHLGAFALPCQVAAISTKALTLGDAEALSLRLLIIEDNSSHAAQLIAKIKAYPQASSYVVDHESNVADALAKFSNAEHEADARVCNSNARRSYDIVFVDRFMPMERGAREDSEAGVFVFVGV
jgi:hypothetical protein